jgi:DNA replication protein DnaC
MQTTRTPISPSRRLLAAPRVVWQTPQTLAELLRRHRADDSVTTGMSKLIRPDPIIIDDVGLLPVSSDAAEALFRVIDVAYEKLDRDQLKHQPLRL